jgi:hypothetical protein
MGRALMIGRRVRARVGAAGCRVQAGGCRLTSGAGGEAGSVGRSDRLGRSTKAVRRSPRRAFAPKVSRCSTGSIDRRVRRGAGSASRPQPAGSIDCIDHAPGFAERCPRRDHAPRSGRAWVRSLAGPPAPGPSSGEPPPRPGAITIQRVESAGTGSARWRGPVGSMSLTGGRLEATGHRISGSRMRRGRLPWWEPASIL